MKEFISYLKPETELILLEHSCLICASGEKSGGNSDIPFNDINW